MPGLFSSFASNTVQALIRRSVLKLTLFTFILVLFFYNVLNAFFFHVYNDTAKLDTTFPFDSSDSAIAVSQISVRNLPGKSPVKVYLYDLPTRFTYGVIQHHSLVRGGRAVEDVTALKYPGHQHMAEWHLFLDLIRPETERVGSPVVRVSDPEEADLFYVAFFSSLSLIVNPTLVPVESDTGKPTYGDAENQQALVEWLEEQEYWKRNNGRDHVIIASDPNALYWVMDRVKNSVLLVADFGRLRPDQGSIVKDVVIPYSHRLRTYEGDVGLENRNTLLFFMGARHCKECAMSDIGQRKNLPNRPSESAGNDQKKKKKVEEAASAIMDDIIDEPGHENKQVMVADVEVKETTKRHLTGLSEFQQAPSYKQSLLGFNEVTNGGVIMETKD